jgi:D-tyrosyl-tRNA(Tyr) deacylase
VKIVLQRVSSAQVSVDHQICGKIGHGLLILLGVEPDDEQGTMEWGARKCAELRIFQDDHDKMNLSLAEVNGEALVISQFTLCADAQKGRRPSFIGAAPPDLAKPLYEHFTQTLRTLGIRTASGIFAAKMSVSLVNEGPVTIILEQ